MKISVTETPVTYYDTSVTRSAQSTNNYYLYLGTNTDTTTVPLTEQTNTVHWTATDAGGTLVFTNQRQTYDITVEKVLHDNKGLPGMFSFTASYVVDGRTVTKTFNVTSGTPNITDLAGIPAGAELTITEGNNGDYIAKYKIDSGSLTDAVTVPASGTQTGSATAAIMVDADKTVTFDNTLKSYPVKFRLFDQYGNPLSGMFSLSSSLGSLGNQLYADPNVGGIFYQDATFWIDTYTLSENIIPTGYIGLSTPVTVTVTSEGITTNSDMIVVSPDPNVTGGYIITVYNIVPSVDITLTKVLVDPLLNQRTFSFTVGYTYDLYDSQNPSVLLKTITRSETYSIQATTGGQSEVIKVPGGATVTIEENQTLPNSSIDLFAIYDVTYSVSYDPSVTNPNPDLTATNVSGTSWTRTIGDDYFTVTFTNTRKTKTVTVTKTLVDTQASGAIDFYFDALLQYNNAGIGNYTLNSTNSIVTADGTGQTPAGKATFTLSPTTNAPASVVLTVPYGVKLTVSEDTTRTVTGTTKTVAETYDTTYSVNSGTEVDGSSYVFTSVTDDQTLAFTNSRKGADLTITKTVTGDMGDRAKAFTFTIANLPSGDSFTYKKYSTTDGSTWTELTGEGGTLSSSAYTFTLTHHQKVVIESLPLNMQLTITETNENYTTTWQLGSNTATTGSSTTVTLTDDEELAVTNYLPAVAPTGYRAAVKPFAVMLAMSLLLLAGAGVPGRRDRRRRKHEA